MRFAFGEFLLDTEAPTLERRGRRVPIAPKAFDLLVYLIEHRERVVSPEEALDVLWRGVSVGPGALSQTVHKARQAVGDDGEHQVVLRTEHGRGFRFVADVSVVDAPLGATPGSRGARIRWATAAGIAALLLVAAGAWLLGYWPEAARAHSLAVLPFENMSGDPGQEYFSDGISEELLNTLTQFEGLKVVGQTSSFSFKGSDADLKEIGEALDVDMIVEGSVRKMGNRVRITAQLVNAEDGFHLWSETFDRELGDIFAIQSDVARQVARALAVRFPSAAQARIHSRLTENVEAYDFYLRGKEYCRRPAYLKKDLRGAQRMFEEAVELEPRFALAWAWLSIVHGWNYWFRFDDSAQRLMQAKAAADRAAQLDPDLPEAHLALAYYHYFGHRAYEQALEELALMEQRAPRDPELFEARGYINRRQGNWNEAIANLKTAASLDPRDAYLYYELGVTYRALRHYDEAERFYDKALAIRPNNPNALVGRAYLGLLRDGDLEPLRALHSSHADFEPLARFWIEFLSRDYSAALAVLSEFEDEIFVAQDFYDPKSMYAGLVHLAAGRTESATAAFKSARVILEAASPERQEDPALHGALGLVYAGLGMKEEAIREGKRAVELLPVSRDAFSGPEWVMVLAWVYTLVGEYEAAINEIEYVLSVPHDWSSTKWIQLDPAWDPLRADPRFADLLRRMNNPGS